MTSAAHIAAARAAGDEARRPRPMICRVCGDEFMGASYAKYCGRDCYNVIRVARRRDAKIEYISLEGRPRVPRNLPIPAEWVVKRELSEPDRTVYETTGPSPCYYCCHMDECRERNAALDERPLPCFGSDE